MIGYVTLGTNDLPRASKFYDELLALTGCTQQMDWGNGLCWGRSMQEAVLGIVKPHNGEPATVGNGVMVAIAAKDPAQVDALHAKALSLGGTCEGPPGPRGTGFYAAYFRDLDGNKLNAFVMG
jgi:catechol 2,3-dioxygenase-like lactoylglutathione lyase family enzyme